MAEESGALLQTLSDTVRVIAAGGKFLTTNSLVSATKAARVEPLCVISQDCTLLEYTPDVLSTILNVFAAYYMQAVSLTAQIGNIRIIQELDRLNPDRDINTFIASLESYGEKLITSNSTSLCESAYAYRLPTSNNVRAIKDECKRLALEAYGDSVKDGIDDVKQGIEEFYEDSPNLKDWRNTTGSGSDKLGLNKNELSKMTDATPLAVGKIVEVEFKVNNQSVKVPVTIRLNSIPLSNNSVIKLLGLKSDDTTFMERFHAWRSGRIGFWKDLIFCQDLITEHKKNTKSDSTGVYTETIDRARRNTRYGFLSLRPSLATASNIYVISETVALETERKLGGKLSNPKIREKAFESTYAMLIVVIDRQYERVTIYTRGINAYTNHSVKEFKSSKGKGPDIGDLLKALMAGNSPSF